jgi:DNA-binding MarR family transcriptional regulator
LSDALRLDAFLPYRLSVASNAVSDAIASAYRALFGLAIPEWRLVAVIAEADAITPQAVAERTRMDKVTVSRAAAALTGRGLLRRTPNPRDARSHLLALTAAGRRLYAEVAPKALELEARLFDGWSSDDRAALEAALKRLETAAGSLA